MNASASVAVRVAGAIGALGYLFGMVDGPMIGAIAGLALITFGRSAVSPRGSELVAPAAFGVLAGAGGAVALRWGTLELEAIRGAQGVLGPTIVVDPQPVAIFATGALVAAGVALGLWLGARLQEGFLRWWWWVEAATGATFLAALFSGPPPSDVGQGLLWLGSALGIGTAAVATAWFARDWSVRADFIALGACGLLVTGAAAVTGSYL